MGDPTYANVDHWPVIPNGFLRETVVNVVDPNHSTPNKQIITNAPIFQSSEIVPRLQNAKKL